MGRRTLKHELIFDESARKVTFKKRRSGLLKKLKELTILCGVTACAIIFSPYSSFPDVWPSPSEAFLVLEKFGNLPPKKQGKYMMDQESFLMTNISKLNEKLEKQRNKNQKAELELLFDGCMTGRNLHNLNSLKNLNDLCDFLKEKIIFSTNRIECAKKSIKD